MELISILIALSAPIAAISLFVACYFPIINYWGRPKLILQPEKKEQSNESYFGVSVENKGKNIAKDVYGEFEVNNSCTQINWNNWFFRKTSGHSERIFQLDINPGSTYKQWFIAARLADETRRTLEGSEVLVTLNWEYHGQKTLTKKLVLAQRKNLK
ncbi:hypothetical protein C5S29_03975 [ANME-1 cluster archaeon GoMg3.2]|nr:hypothetical protein [ANME-1 cluster archaeon GoMg3.2]